jgi:hypothetical protein
MIIILVVAKDSPQQSSGETEHFFKFRADCASVAFAASLYLNEAYLMYIHIGLCGRVPV